MLNEAICKCRFSADEYRKSQQIGASCMLIRKSATCLDSPYFSRIVYEPWQDKTNSDCAPSEDSDQPGHPPSLIRVFAVRMKKAWVLSYPLSAQRRLWSDWTDAQAGQTVTLLVLSCRGSFCSKCYPHGVKNDVFQLLWTLSCLSS